MRATLTQRARQLGGEVSGGQVLVPGPGHSPSDRSLAVRFDPQAPGGFIAFSHAGDPFEACRDHVKALLGIGSDQRPLRDQRQRRNPAPRDPDRSVRAGALWREARDPRGTMVETYLASRGLALPPEAAGEAIRFHPECAPSSSRMA